MNELWNTLASRANVVLDALQHEKLARYLDLLAAANQTMNLTRIVDRPAAELHHIADALTLLPYLPAGAIRIADVGSGGGVPGIPLAIVRPDARVMLIESTQKKGQFLLGAAAELGLSNITVLPQRAEEVGLSDLRETFDVAIARAVATLDWLAEWCLPLVKVRGRMLAMKGQKVAAELPLASRAIKMLGGASPITHPVALVGTDNHVIIEIIKSQKSDKRLPRPATQAKGRPL